MLAVERPANLRDLATAVAVPAVVAALAVRNGGYDATAWGWSSLLLLGLFVTALRAWAPGRLELAFLGLLGGLLAWIAASALWSLDPASSVLDAERMVVYLAGAAAALALVWRSRAEYLLAGLLGVAVAVAVYALLLRIFAEDGGGVASADPGGADRLAEPIGYSNGLAVFVAIGVPLALGFAIQGRTWLVRGAAASSLPLLLATMYFTFGRAAWLALAIGLAVAALLKAPRVALAGVAVALVAIVVVLGGPLDAAEQFDAPPAPVRGEPQERLLSLSGSSRSEYWRVAWEDFLDHPWLGSGAGSFQRRWYELRPSPLPVRDAHSLYLETLAELGPLGLALLLGALALALAAGLRARRNPLARWGTSAYAVFLVHSGVDWDWELPAVGLVGLLCGCALLVVERQEAQRPGRPVRIAAIGAALVLACASAFAFVGNRALAQGTEALDRADATEAREHARTAARWQPWSPKPRQLAGETYLLDGELEAARASFRRGLDRDERDWELWLGLALASDGDAQRRALAQARRLNPLEPVLDELEQ